MASRQVRKVSITTHRIRKSSQPSIIFPRLIILVLPPLLGLFRLGQVYPSFAAALAIYFVIINIWTCVLYWHDKVQSRIVGNWRVSENSLHFCEFVGGWPGAFSSQRIFQHKTRKVSYQAVF
jgi:uncharacterized membrane protein YsdA (DUF1294 family)